MYSIGHSWLLPPGTRRDVCFMGTSATTIGFSTATAGAGADAPTGMCAAAGSGGALVFGAPVAGRLSRVPLQSAAAAQPAAADASARATAERCCCVAAMVSIVFSWKFATKPRLAKVGSGSRRGSVGTLMTRNCTT